VPAELTIIAVTALLAGLLLVGVMLAGRVSPVATDTRLAHPSPGTSVAAAERESPAADSTLRVAWWLTITIVLLGVGISGSFAADQGAIFMLGAAAVAAVVLLHEVVPLERRGRLVRVGEVVVAIALIGVLLVLTGFASSPFAMLFALVSVSAALASGPRAGLGAAALATVAFGAILAIDPGLTSYGAEDALRLSIGLGATWLLAFVAIAYAGHQRRAIAHAVNLSRTDPLTGLYNRSQLFATLELEVSRTRRSDRGFCVLMIDLDGLKAINDSGGHLRGDEVLRSLARVIAGSIRTVDSAYRYGGDEFVVLLPETDIVGAFVVAEKVRAGAEDLGMAMGGPEALTSVSIGLVSHPEDGLSAEELMNAADRAMYQAKSLGKNQISGNPRPRPPLLGRRSTVLEPAPRPAAAAAAVAMPEADEPPSPPESAPPAIPRAANGRGVVVPAADRAVAVELGPIVAPPPEPAAEPMAEPAAAGVPSERRSTGEPPTEAPANHNNHDEDQPDPQEVRRQIAVARRSFDPDHQIRRAMDAFLSPTVEREQPPRDH
jgi:diguanylate cyclase (GGDEF)-like protein